jgi:hypothetical protein
MDLRNRLMREVTRWTRKIAHLKAGRRHPGFAIAFVYSDGTEDRFAMHKVGDGTFDVEDVHDGVYELQKNSLEAEMIMTRMVWTKLSERVESVEFAYKDSALTQKRWVIPLRSGRDAPPMEEEEKVAETEETQYGVDLPSAFVALRAVTSS